MRTTKAMVPTRPALPEGKWQVVTTPARRRRPSPIGGPWIPPVRVIEGWVLTPIIWHWFPICGQPFHYPIPKITPCLRQLDDVWVVNRGPAPLNGDGGVDYHELSRLAAYVNCPACRLFADRDADPELAHENGHRNGMKGRRR